MRKKGVFFSTDALIATVLIILVLLIAFPAIKNTRQNTEMHHDFLKTLSALKVSDADYPYLQSLISQGIINDTNKSLLEQIGEFYVTNLTRAKMLANAIFTDIETNKNIGLWYVSDSGQETLIYSKNSTPIETAENVETTRQIISGIQEGESVTGFSARAFLTSGMLNNYYYLGGYIGDGNISIRAEYNGNITSANIEVVINKDFEIFVNNVSDGTTYAGSPDEFTPISYPIPIDNFNSGINTIEFRGGNLHITGGFIKVTYQSSSIYESASKYYFPGINGLINIYDGIYIPGDLNTLKVYLHLNSEYSSFLTVGNTTIYKNTTLGEQTITFDNSELQSILNYEELSNKTTPIRIGLENVSYILNTSRNSDVVSVTDLSGSMSWGTPTKVSQAIQANRLLVDIILNSTGNRVGLVGYDDTARKEWYHNLSNDNESLNNKLDDYATGGGTCICCGINKAIANFNPTTSNSDAIQSRVSQSTDDAEELIIDGDIYSTSSDLELTYDTYHGGNQKVGMRFQNLNIPQGVAIASAYIEFETDETNSGTTHLTFFAEASDNAQTFSSSSNDITNRPKTLSSVTWSNVPAWNTVSEKHQTPDLSPIIQEVINRPGWTNGNSIVIIVNGTGTRTAESYNGESTNAPLLVLSYRPLNCGNGIIGGVEECDDGNSNDNDACTNLCLNAICGDGILNSELEAEQCDDGNTIEGDGCSSTCEIEERFKAMVVLSDGQANQKCPEQNTGNAAQDAIQAACDAKQNYNITVHSVGFGSGVDSDTLIDIALCGEGTYYFGEVEDLANVYTQIANSIIETQYAEQTVQVSGNVSTILYPDSYIEFDYIKPESPFGLIITTEKKFNDNITGSFIIPENSRIIETLVTSYSGPRWTADVSINNENIYNITKYGQDYLKIGDPYIINVENSKVNQYNNVSITTATSPNNSSIGSEYNKIIYTIAKNASAYSQISPTKDGCTWTIQFEDYSNITIPIPSSYLGENICKYQELSQQHNNNDATQNAIYELLKILDLDLNNKIELKFTEQDLQIDLTEITGIPYTWSTEVQARIWY